MCEISLRDLRIRPRARNARSGRTAELVQRQQVLVLAGGDAYGALSGSYSVIRLPTLRYRYAKNGEVSQSKSLVAYPPTILDARWGGSEATAVREALADFQPDVVDSDAEVFTSRVARRLGLPLIGFDHFGPLVFCRPRVTWQDRLEHAARTWACRRLFPNPDRAVVCSFFDTPPRRCAPADGGTKTRAGAARLSFARTGGRTRHE